MPSPKKSKKTTGTRRSPVKGPKPSAAGSVASRTRSRSRTRLADGFEEPVPIPVIKTARTPARRADGKFAKSVVASRTRSMSRTRLPDEEPVPVPIVKTKRTPASKIARPVVAKSSPVTKNKKKSPMKKLEAEKATIKFSPVRTRNQRQVVEETQMETYEDTDEEELLLEEEAPVALHEILQACEEGTDNMDEDETLLPAFGPNTGMIDSGMVRQRPKNFRKSMQNIIDAEHPSNSRDPQMILQEDEAKYPEDEATGLISRNNIIVNVPVKSRLKTFATYLGMGTSSIALHAAIFMISFLIINLLSTYFFPSSEDERVNYFYEMLTRQDTGSFLVHLQHTERWLIFPRLTSEVIALFATICFSHIIAKYTKPEEPQHSTTRVKLFKLC